MRCFTCVTFKHFLFRFQSFAVSLPIICCFISSHALLFHCLLTVAAIDGSSHQLSLWGVAVVSIMDNDDVDDLTSVASVLAQGTAAMAMENKRLDRPPFWDMMSPHLVDGHGAQATMSAAEAGAVAGRQFLWSSEWNRLKRTWDQACSSAALPAVVVCRDRSPVQPEPAEPGAELAPAEGSPPRKRRNDVTPTYE